MFSILLAIIYVAFISLGLPDSLLGSAWPSMYENLQVPISYAGRISMIIAFGTIVSSFYSDRLIKRLGTGLVTAISVAMTAAALWGFSISGSFLALCMWAVPYGLGAGSVDAALNNYVALNYESRHMSWLHCFWGIGATIGPNIMGVCLTGGLGWQGGYRSISIIQVVLTAVLIFSLPLWKRLSVGKAEEHTGPAKSLKLGELLKLPSAKPVLCAFFAYCALESTVGLWAGSYLVMNRGMTTDMAAQGTSLFFLGITVGRLAAGFITTKLGDRKMIFLGQMLIFAGGAILLLPLGNLPALTGILLLGLGCAPIYPSLLHQTPDNFGESLSQQIMGMQMACAYAGSTLMPLLFGILAEHITINIYPFYGLLIGAFMFFMTLTVNKRKHKMQ